MARFQWIFFLAFIAADTAICQRKSASDSSAVLLGVKGHFGDILPHSRHIAHLTDSWLWALQADIARVRYTQKSWKACNCYSQNGLSLSYFNFNKPRVLGSAISLALFAQPQLTYGRIALFLRGGVGVSYLTRVYHPDTNPENLFFSDPWSALLVAQVSARYRLQPLFSLLLEASYNHISNGGKQRPNKGMNFPTVGLNLEYALKYAPLFRRKKSRSFDRSLRYYGGIFYNTRSVDEWDFNSAERKMVLGLHAGVYKPLALMHGLGVAFEAAHDGALKSRAKNANESFDHHIISGLIRHHFLFGRFDFSQALGIYLHKEYPTPHAVFQRYGLSYLIFGKLTASVSLKAHVYTAEQMDVRVGVLF